MIGNYEYKLIRDMAHALATRLYDDNRIAGMSIEDAGKRYDDDIDEITNLILNRRHYASK